MNGRANGNTGRRQVAGRRKKRRCRATATATGKHLTKREVERLIEATRGSRNEVRDRCLLLLVFCHGLRVSEACRLKLDQIDTEKSRVLHIARLKGGLSASHPLREDELRAVKAWLKQRARMKPMRQGVFCE